VAVVIRKGARPWSSSSSGSCCWPPALVISSWSGWRLHAAQTAKTRGGPAGPFYSWFLNVVKKAFPFSPGRGHTTGERVAVFGSVVFALGVLMTVVGLIA
jgi:hypothetical protein